jgi:pimeloyl-ACP methyl ester carboxylesterase
VAELARLGHDAVGVDLPIDRADATTEDYARAAAGAFCGGAPPIVVAHSMAGLVAPLVAERIPVRGIVYLAALLRRPGRSCADDRADGFNDDISPPGFGEDLLRDAQRLTYWPSAEAAGRVLYHDCSEAEIAWAFAQLRHQKGYWTDRTAQTGWPSVPAISIVCAEDRAVNPHWSRRMARTWLGVEPIEFPGGHTPHLARPRELAALLDRLAFTTFAG